MSYRAIKTLVERIWTLHYTAFSCCREFLTIFILRLPIATKRVSKAPVWNQTTVLYLSEITALSLSYKGKILRPVVLRLPRTIIRFTILLRAGRPASGYFCSVRHTLPLNTAALVPKTRLERVFSTPLPTKGLEHLAGYLGKILWLIVVTFQFYRHWGYIIACPLIVTT